MLRAVPSMMRIVDVLYAFPSLLFIILLMINLSKTHPGDLRGYQLYLWKKRGVFQTMVSRHYGPGRSTPASPIYSELELSQEEIAEIEYRFEALKPYQKPGEPNLDLILRREAS